MQNGRALCAFILAWLLTGCAAEPPTFKGSYTEWAFLYRPSPEAQAASAYMVTVLTADDGSGICDVDYPYDIGWRRPHHIAIAGTRHGDDLSFTVPDYADGAGTYTGHISDHAFDGTFTYHLKDGSPATAPFHWVRTYPLE
jgi:hypothetical protein